MKKTKIPRRLKKELCKVDCLETSQPSIKMEPNPFSPSKMMFTQNLRVKLKEGVKMNKWTKLLVRNILREVRRNHKRNMELAMKRQMDWTHKGINPMNSYEEMMKSMSQEEFRREYLNEPLLTRDLDELRPSCVIIDDTGEQWQPANRREVEEFVRRCNICPHIQEPDGNVVAVLKHPSLSKEKLEEFRAEWERCSRSSQPITVIDPEASVEFIPAKRPHRLHNHPRMEVELGLNEREVIVDQEFVHLFKNAYPVRGRKSKDDYDHFIVSKREFLERMEESRGRQVRLIRQSEEYQQVKIYTNESDR